MVFVSEGERELPGRQGSSRHGRVLAACTSAPCRLFALCLRLSFNSGWCGGVFGQTDIFSTALLFGIRKVFPFQENRIVAVATSPLFLGRIISPVKPTPPAWSRLPGPRAGSSPQRSVPLAFSLGLSLGRALGLPRCMQPWWWPPAVLELISLLEASVWTAPAPQWV